MQGDTVAAAKLTDGLWKLQRHLRITAVALQDIESASFHAVSESFPVIPKLQVCFAHSLFTDCIIHDCLSYGCLGSAISDQVLTDRKVLLLVTLCNECRKL